MTGDRSQNTDKTASEVISLAHGNGGRLMRELIEQVIARHLANPVLNTDCDAATLPLELKEGELLFTTDSFTVQPLEFPGGDIGSLAVHGTVNDLSVAGAVPQYLSLNLLIEEGFDSAQLERIIASLAGAAREANVQVVTGDTKVLRRGEGGGLYLATTGVGVRSRSLQLGMDRIGDGDAILVSGPVGDHGIAVMLAREQFGLRGDVRSDSANVFPLTEKLTRIAGLKFMRDPTRGGLASVLNEIQRGSGCGVHIREPDVPVRDPVRAVCEMLGYDPFYLACEGRVVAVVAADQADEALQAMQSVDAGQDARIIGHAQTGQSRVVLETELGGERILEELEEDPLPRIC